MSVTLTESPMCSIRGSTTAAVEFRAGFISRRVETASRTHIGNRHSTRTRSAACRNRCPASARGRRWPADAIAPGHEEDAANPALQQGADPDYLPQLSETGGIEGLLIFNEGQYTYQNAHTDFMRILLQACNIPNVWNYTRRQVGAETLNIPVWHVGQLIPIHGSHTVQSITNRMKFVAEDKTNGVGLKMNGARRPRAGR